MNNRALKDIFLLIAGTLAGVLSTLLFEKQRDCFLIFFIGAAFILSTLYGMSFLEEFYHRIVLFRRKVCALRKKLIGILQDIDWNDRQENICTWTDITSNDWYQIIYKIQKRTIAYPKIKPKKMILHKNINKYNYILNPYGGVYPESDTVEQTNLEKIFRYVAEGGIFINVADIPGYWMYDTNLKTKIDATPSEYGFNGLPLKPFEKTPFMEKLSIRIVNSDIFKNSNCKYTCPKNEYSSDEISGHCERFAIIEKNLLPIIVIEIGNMQEKYSPLFFVPYGKGKFLISLYFIDSKNPKNKAMIEKMVNSVIKE